jgi:DNA helicase-2/ATP-dependent DNA helicase PcrA
MDQRAPIITGQLLEDEGFLRLFFGSYLYALFRRGESEYEDAEDPFPRGRIPFLTIHQAKGLEFPVVVLGNPRKDDRGPQRIETLIRPLLPVDRDAEPLDRVGEFDIMRMFYVALSRAQNLLIVAHFAGRGQRVNEPFQQLFDRGVPCVPSLDPAHLPLPGSPAEPAPRNYSYTVDYLNYLRCPRQYMIFHRYDFVPSRSQTMVFGTLVHRTMDDLHQYLIARRAAQ